MMEIPMDFLNKHGLNDGLKDISNPNLITSN